MSTSLLNTLLSLDFEQIENIASNNSAENSSQHFLAIAQILKNAGQNPEADQVIILRYDKTSKEDIFSNLVLGNYYLYNSSGSTEAFKHLIQAVNIGKKLTDKNLLKLAYLSLLNLYARELQQSSTDYFKYLQEYKDIASSDIEIAWFHINEVKYHSKSIEANALPQFYKAFNRLARHFEEKHLEGDLKAHLYYYKGLYHRLRKELTPSKTAYLQCIDISESKPYLKYLKYTSYIHLCLIESSQESYDKAFQNLEAARAHYDKSDTLRFRFIQNRFSAIYYYAKIKDYEKAYDLLLASITNEQQLDFRKNTLKINEMNVRLQTVEKEKQILKEQAQKRQLAMGLGGGLGAVSIIAVLVYRNTKRKQRIAEQERELQIQKTEKVLKNREIETINAMVSGQEKERKRLASELHDNVGSTLATVRMHVDNLQRNLSKVDDPKALLEKTNSLIDEAYQKVRRISHERNAGVLAKDGLLPAVHKLAQSVSSPNGLQVAVEDFGLEQRLSNELEITIFRIIQELITNIVKHAEASEATLSLTQFDNELNIIIEDNGKGFIAGNLKAQPGIGLGSIEQRVEHLEGTMGVDSTLGKGTSILIDIPLH